MDVNVIWTHVTDFSMTVVESVVRLPLTGSSHFYWLFLLTSLLLGLLAYNLYYRNGPFSLRRALRFCFPKEIYGHPSAIVDYKIFLASFITVPLLALVTNVIYLSAAQAVANPIENWLGTNPNPPPKGGMTLVLFTITIALLHDFRSFFIHYLHHRIPILWSFHRVHHTAEVLTPITLLRKHPVYDTFGTLVFAPIDGVALAIVFYLFWGYFSPILFFTANIVETMYRLLGSSLRHSHIWLSWGPILSRVAISPAQHQIHHSIAPQHANKNFGEMFAFWDWMFGTLYVPTEKEDLVFGIGEDVPQEHPTLKDAYLAPFRDCIRIIGARLKPS